jgi:site-specific DNA-methyltransferase (adenine-specific)
MKPYYADKYVTIFNCDCRDILPSLDPVDLVLTDPPYGIDYQSNMRVATKQFDKIANDAIDITIYYPQFHRLLTPDGIAVVFCSFKNYSRDFIVLEQYFNIRNCLIWFKGGGGIGDLEHSLATDYEMAIVAHKGNGKIRGKRNGSVWQVGKVNPGDMVHPTEKPADLISQIVLTFSDEGNIVLDPFLGSGTTAHCCKKLQRKCIGIEIEEKFCEIAARRCMQEAMDFGAVINFVAERQAELLLE